MKSFSIRKMLVPVLTLALVMSIVGVLSQSAPAHAERQVIQRTKAMPFAALSNAGTQTSTQFIHDDDEDHQGEWLFEEEEMEAFGELELMSSMLELIGHIAEIADDPATAGVFAVYGAEEYVAGDDLIEFYESIIDDAAEPATVRALHMKLSELYGADGDAEKALAHLRAIIVE